ncbi:UDP-glucose 4-epimerase GalE [Roseibacterium sp. SDUM158016]|uniref:UDP-glucose 4-epimerase GalE n=1 Tax=Roseicyclus sediminis TaxID=2980997 RepID=UPI0021CF0F12|nr:UDP-glucose 4-epimerase GalE [Roseibacterium sp. SDUM158016]MCU4653764.1 UDP-glucose 4-epimerase GalE [Roseibacterium sp. SDUM158016]
MTRILVTGGAGYVGSHTTLHLLRAGHEVLSYDNYANSSSEVLRRVAELAGRAPEIVEGDVCDRKTLDAVMARFDPEAVIHFAGLKAVGQSVKKPLSYYWNNVTGTQNLLESMQEHGCRRIVFSSSATVYGEARYLPIDEDHPIAPTNPYGRTKAFVEGIIGDWCHAWPEASAVLLRYFNPVGADASGRIGEDPNGTPENLVPYIARVAANRLEKLGVFGDDYDTRDGTGERDYIHVSDLAEAHLSALTYACRSSGCEAINVGTGRGATVFEMLKAFEATIGREIPYEVLPRRSGDVARSLAAVQRAESLLGWRAHHDIADMCASTWHWQSCNPDGYGA